MTIVGIQKYWNLNATEAEALIKWRWHYAVRDLMSSGPSFWFGLSKLGDFESQLGLGRDTWMSSEVDLAWYTQDW